ncbi:LytTR family transcriptional regulator [Echinicola soli]|uniref:LytTR family transcriptional regulator n=1 Tax=Echinicola soli TaxID=2591634 RepID=A0A514CGT3_9BACT|nr:LytTR family transcriptional regulator [Echinicola soli]
MNTQDFLILKNESNLVRIELEHIVYLTIKDYILTCATVCGERFKCSNSLKAVEGGLPPHFVRINRNTVINTDCARVLCSKKRTVVMKDQSAHHVAYRRMGEVKTFFG